MSRMDALKAELALAELEEKLVAAKAGKTGADKMKALKDDLRAKRQKYREKYRGEPEGVAVQPATVDVKAGVTDVG